MLLAVFNYRFAKNILLGNDCHNCRYMTDIWRFADDNIKCIKTKKVYNMNYTCSKWKLAKSDNIRERDYYRNKYIEDRKFIKRCVEADKIIANWKK